MILRWIPLFELILILGLWVDWNCVVLHEILVGFFGRKGLKMASRLLLEHLGRFQRVSRGLLVLTN